MKKTAIAFLAVVAIIAAYFLFVPKPDQQSPPTVAQTTPSVQTLEKVNFRLSWVHDLAYAGLYLAKDNGHFAKNGFDVSLEPGGFGLDPIKQVASGADQFGISGAGNLLMAREKGIPVVAIGIYFQQSGVGYFSRKESGITSIKDFAGKRVGVQTGSDTDTLYRVLLLRNGMDSSVIKEVPIQYDMAPFFSNQIDVLPGYVTNQAITLRDQSIEINVITAQSEGLNYYGSVFFTSEKLIRERPEMVKRFVHALQLGWKDAFANKDQTVSAAQKWAPDFDITILPKIYDAAIPLIKADIQGVPINGMDEERWRITKQVMQDSGLLKEDIDLSKAYTKEFLADVFSQ
jgi:ABC-type nitrate/sulfonate/bicarbonate transport system substrate-binding protein